MRLARHSAASLLALSVFATATHTPSSAEPADIALRPVKYSDLAKMVRALKGKVVIVDFWAEY
jgi:hypothetical protein